MPGRITSKELEQLQTSTTGQVFSQHKNVNRIGPRILVKADKAAAFGVLDGQDTAAYCRHLMDLSTIDNKEITDSMRRYADRKDNGNGRVKQLLSPIIQALEDGGISTKDAKDVYDSVNENITSEIEELSPPVTPPRHRASKSVPRPLDPLLAPSSPDSTASTPLTSLASSDSDAPPALEPLRMSSQKTATPPASPPLPGMVDMPKGWEPAEEQSPQPSPSAHDTSKHTRGEISLPFSATLPYSLMEVEEHLSRVTKKNEGIFEKYKASINKIEETGETFTPEKADKHKSEILQEWTKSSLYTLDHVHPHKNRTFEEPIEQQIAMICLTAVCMNASRTPPPAYGADAPSAELKQTTTKKQQTARSRVQAAEALFATQSGASSASRGDVRPVSPGSPDTQDLGARSPGTQAASLSPTPSSPLNYLSSDSGNSSAGHTSSLASPAGSSASQEEPRRTHSLSVLSVSAPGALAGEQTTRQPSSTARQGWKSHFSLTSLPALKLPVLRRSRTDGGAPVTAAGEETAATASSTRRSWGSIFSRGTDTATTQPVDTTPPGQWSSKTPGSFQEAATTHRWGEGLEGIPASGAPNKPGTPGNSR